MNLTVAAETARARHGQQRVKASPRRRKPRPVSRWRAPVNHPIDRSAWGYGDWEDEPDLARWEHAGLRCLAVRQGSGGNWCGYVHVPAGHPWAVGAYQRPVLMGGRVSFYATHGPADDADVHGCVTYQGRTEPHGPRYRRTLGLWVGFDCGHAWDMRPGDAFYGMFGREPDQVYRCLMYVRAEVNRLAEQAADVTSARDSATAPRGSDR